MQILYTVAVCDDEKVCRDKAIGFLREIEKLTKLIFHIHEFSSGEEMLENKESLVKFDFILLDVELGELNGLETAKQIKEYREDIYIIFISSYKDYVFESFRLNTVDYLVKPVKLDKLKEAISRLVTKLNKEQVKYIYSNNGSITSLNYEEIIFFEKVHNNIVIHTDDMKYKQYITIRQLQKDLKEGHFILINQGCLVNMNWISSIENNDLNLANGDILLISRSRKKAVTELFLKRMVVST